MRYDKTEYKRLAKEINRLQFASKDTLKTEARHFRRVVRVIEEMLKCTTVDADALFTELEK